MKSSPGISLTKGFSLLEVIIVMTITAILIGIGSLQIQYHLAKLTLERWCLQWISDAQLARSLSVNTAVEIKFIANSSSWLSGWHIIKNGNVVREFNPTHYHAYRFIELDPSMKQTQGFVDSLSKDPTPRLIFTSGESAQLENGGFMASRLIVRHQRFHNLTRHIILSPGGRLRLCDPNSDRLRCQ